MINREKKLKEFFSGYAARFNQVLAGGDADIEATVESFASCFLLASPQGVACSTNDEQFAESVSKGYEFYKSIGTKSMDIISIEVTNLDKHHDMTKIHWRSVYDKEDHPDSIIEFDVFYFTQSLQGDPVIFAYITGDEQKVLAENGLIEENHDSEY